MSSENIEIKVQDKVDTGIAANLRGIAAAARDGHSGITRLQGALDKLKVGDGLLKIQDSLSKTALRHQRLQTEMQRTQLQMANVEAAIQRAVAAEARANLALAKLTDASAKAAIQTERLATAQNKTTASYFEAEKALNRAVAAERNAATSSQRLATEQQRTATAAGQAATAQQRLATEAQRTATAQNNAATAATNLANAQQRLVTSQTNGATAAQRLSTAQQQTATATANAAAATTRAGTAATQASTAQQNLANAQARGTVQAQNLATAQQRTATATSQAAAAQSRAQIAAIKLQQAQNGLNGVVKNGSGVFSEFLGKVTAVTTALLSVNAITKTADAYTTLQNKLQNVTDNAPQVQRLTDELFALADRTRSGVESTATAFVRFDRSLKSMGKSQEDTLRMTETVNKALIVSGATVQESASALLQLSQAFNSGKLAGDEFRAVSENMPIVLDYVAKALNVPINQVKKLASEGKITSEVLYNAFRMMQERVDKIFGKTTPTIGQSMQVLSNNWTKFVGELDKSIGITSKISGLIMALSKNLDLLAAAAAVTGAVLLVGFGPALVGAITTATTAVLGFTAAVMANPFGAAAVAITAGIAALTLWGDKVKLGKDELYNLQDVAAGVWQTIQEGANSAGKWLQDNLGGAITWLKGQFVGMNTFFSDFFGTIGSVVKGVANFIIGAFVAAFRVVTITWNRFPDIMQAAFNGVMNIAATAIENVVNYWQKGLKLISGAIATIAPGLADSLNGFMENMTLTIPRLDTSQAKGAATEIADAVSDAFNSDYIGRVGNAIAKNAMMAANARRAAVDSDNGVALRGEGKNTTVAEQNEKAAKAAEKRARAMAKINEQLDNEIERMFILQPQREAQQRIDQIEEQLIGKGIKLKKEELDSITKKVNAIIKAKEVQREYDRVYEEAVGPARDYNNTLEASQKLLTSGAISTEQYARAVTKAVIAYTQTVDPLYEFNKGLDDQMKLLQFLPKQREIELAIQQKQNEELAKGNILTDQQITQMRERLTLQQQLNLVDTEKNSLMEASVYKREKEVAQLKAINELLKNKDSGFTKTDALTALSGTDLGQFLQGSQDMMNAQIAQYESYYERIAFLRQENVIGEETAAQARQKIWVAQQSVQLSTANEFWGQLAQLQNSGNKKMAAIGKAAAITQAMIKTYESATSAYAAMSGIPIVGPALGAAAAAAAIAAGMANVAAIRSQGAGFRNGGYTGDGPVNEEAGPVHRREFVFDAASTARLGVGNLMALKNGADNLQGVEAASTAAGGKGGAQGGGSTVQPTNIEIPVKVVTVLNLQEAMVEMQATPEGQRAVLNVIETNPGAVRKIVN